MQRAGKVSVAHWVRGVCTVQRPQASAREAYSSSALALLGGSKPSAISSTASTGVYEA